VELSSSESIAIVSFPEQPEYPRLSRDVLRRLSEHLHAVCFSGAFRGIVVAANSRSFAVGAELEEVSVLGGLSAFDFARLGQSVCRQIARSPLPVVAAVRGFCLGGGLDLALACHRRIAAFDASLGSPGAALGLLTGWSGTQRLARRIGRSGALQMLAGGDRVPAAQALTLGLVDELVPSIDLVPCAARSARRLSQGVRRRQAFLRSPW
jgi:enoyl-CoA hydratase